MDRAKLSVFGNELLDRWDRGEVDGHYVYRQFDAVIVQLVKEGLSDDDVVLLREVEACAQRFEIITVVFERIRLIEKREPTEEEFGRLAKYAVTLREIFSQK